MGNNEITAEEAKKAAEVLRAYCKSKPAICETCIFHKKHVGCTLFESIPGAWKLPGDKNKQGG